MDRRSFLKKASGAAAALPVVLIAPQRLYLPEEAQPSTTEPREDGEFLLPPEYHFAWKWHNLLDNQQYGSVMYATSGDMPPEYPKIIGEIMGRQLAETIIDRNGIRHALRLARTL